MAGSGHVRTDRGAPFYLSQLGVKDSVSVAFIEVSAKASDVSDYTNRWGSDVLPFDYVWFTPYAKRPDPCEAMKKHMMHKAAKEKSQSKEMPSEPNTATETEADKNQGI